jgi:hypothetical protein
VLRKVKFFGIILVGFVLLTSGCKPAAENSTVNINNPSVLQCIKSQSQCEISTDLGNFSLKFSQQQLSENVKTELPFLIELSLLSESSEHNTLHGTGQSTAHSIQKSITKVSAYLEGKEMFMGKVPVFFEQGTNEPVYLAESLLASCSEEQMIWRLWITVELENKTQTFFIDFTSQRL